MRERNKRLLLSLIFGMLMIIPAQIYCERVLNQQFTGSYFDFYPSVFEFISYPKDGFRGIISGLLSICGYFL